MVRIKVPRSLWNLKTYAFGTIPELGYQCTGSQDPILGSGYFESRSHAPSARVFRFQKTCSFARRASSCLVITCYFNYHRSPWGGYLRQTSRPSWKVQLSLAAELMYSVFILMNWLWAECLHAFPWVSASAWCHTFATMNRCLLSWKASAKPRAWVM